MKKLNIASISHASAALRKDVKRSIKKSTTESAPGQPPHTRRGQLKRAILYKVEKNRESAVIGPSIHLISRVGQIHEIGGTYVITPKKPTWNIRIGGHGPIFWNGQYQRVGDQPLRRGRGGRFLKRQKPMRFARLRTSRQVSRAKRIAAAYLRGLRPRRQTYPKREFMKPALDRLKPRIPSYWRAGIRQ